MNNIFQGPTLTFETTFPVGQVEIKLHLPHQGLTLSIKISGQKQDFWLFFILFWAPRLKNLGAHGKI